MVFVRLMHLGIGAQPRSGMDATQCFRPRSSQSHRMRLQIGDRQTPTMQESYNPESIQGGGGRNVYFTTKDRSWRLWGYLDRAFLWAT